MNFAASFCVAGDIIELVAAKNILVYQEEQENPSSCLVTEVYTASGKTE